MTHFNNIKSVENWGSSLLPLLPDGLILRQVLTPEEQAKKDFETELSQWWSYQTKPLACGGFQNQLVSRRGLQLWETRRAKLRRT